MVWGDIQSFAVTEFVRSSDSGIFRSWWPKVVSPYTTLLILLLISYFHHGHCLTLASLASPYLAFLCFVPIIRWTYFIFKAAIAMFGFYMHYFYIGLGFLLLGIRWLINDGLDYVTKKLGGQGQQDGGR